MKKVYDSPFMIEERLISTDVITASNVTRGLDENNNSIEEKDDIQRRALAIFS